MAGFEMRDYQREACEAVRAEWAKGVLRTAVVLPTGAGKTRVIAEMAVAEARAGGRALLLAHRGELLSQMAEACRRVAPDIPVGRVQSTRNEARRPITVAMTPTLASEKRRGRLAPPTLVIYDEVHHAPSPRSMEILRWAGCYDDTRMLGVTATPVRGDKRGGLGDVLESVAFKRDIAWAVDQGWLVRPRGRVVVADHMDLEHAKVSRGDYGDGELGPMISQDTPEIVRAWLEHASERLTVAFCPTVASAGDLRDAFLAEGVAAELVVGSTPEAERTLIYKRLAAGQTRVLVNVGVATEGFDEPAISCVLQCRPTRLPGLYTQIVGRALRLSPGKVDALILDVVGASRYQKLVTLVDLSPSSDYDRQALDDLPCDTCGLPASMAAARRLGLDEQDVCACRPAGERPGPAKLVGPAVYSDIDLLLETSPFTWLSTYAGRPFLPAGDRIAVLWLDKRTDLYRWGHCAARGLDTDGKWLGEGLTLDQARQQAEAWAQREDASLSSRKASWRRGAASEAQVAKARSLRIPGDLEAMSKPDLSDAISIALASRMIDPRPRRNVA